MLDKTIKTVKTGYLILLNTCLVLWNEPFRKTVALKALLDVFTRIFAHVRHLFGSLADVLNYSEQSKIVAIT